MNRIRANKMIVPIRKTPSNDGEYIDELLMGMAAEILWEDRDDFVYIETDYGYRGYVDLSMVSEDTWTSDLVTISGRFVDVTKEVAYDSGLIASVLKGSILKKTGNKQAGRIEVILPDGQCGWLRKQYVKTPIQMEQIREAVVETAYDFLNAQFRWGGKSILGMDVSGFISMVYLYHGIILYRDILLNEREYEIIPEHELQKGDLLFFSGHPALYIGDHEFLHSSAVYLGVLKGSLESTSPLFKEEFSKEECIYARVRGVQ